MTQGLLIALYLFTLAGFLGLDVIRKVPPTLYGALAMGIGTAAALSIVVALPAAAASSSDVSAILTVAAVAFASAGVVGGLLRTKRALRGREGNPREGNREGNS